MRYPVILVVALLVAQLRMITMHAVVANFTIPVILLLIISTTGLVRRPPARDAHIPALAKLIRIQLSLHTPIMFAVTVILSVKHVQVPPTSSAPLAVLLPTLLPLLNAIF